MSPNCFSFDSFEADSFVSCPCSPQPLHASIHKVNTHGPMELICGCGDNVDAARGLRMDLLYYRACGGPCGGPCGGKEHLEDTKPPLILHRSEPKGPLDIGCQTDRVLTKHAFVQAQVKPLFRSKAIQARAPCRNVECSANFPTESPEISQGKRKRCEESDAISSSFCIVGSHNNQTSKEAPPQKSQYVVEEDKLMELFVWCPVCSNNCDVSKSMTKTLLLVKQRCTHCHFTNEWTSHSKPS